MRQARDSSEGTARSRPACVGIQNRYNRRPTYVEDSEDMAPTLLHERPRLEGLSETSSNFRKIQKTSLSSATCVRNQRACHEVPTTCARIKKACHRDRPTCVGITKDV